MSWSFSLTSKNGRCLITKYKLNPQLLGAFPYGNCSPISIMHSLTEIRAELNAFFYSNECRAAAQDAFLLLQARLRENIISLQVEPHCKTCKCNMQIIPVGWSVEEATKYLNVPIEEIYKFDTSY